MFLASERSWQGPWCGSHFWHLSIAIQYSASIKLGMLLFPFKHSIFFLFFSFWTNKNFSLPCIVTSQKCLALNLAAGPWSGWPWSFRSPLTWIDRSIRGTANATPKSKAKQQHRNPLSGVCLRWWSLLVHSFVCVICCVVDWLVDDQNLCRLQVHGTIAMVSRSPQSTYTKYKCTYLAARFYVN